MTVSISTTNIKGFERPKKCISELIDVGVKGIAFDLESFCAPAFLELHGLKKTEFDVQKRKATINNFLEECINSSISLDVVRAPHLKWDTKRTDLNDLMLQIGRDSMEVCTRAGAKNIVIQPLFAGIEKQDLWQKNYYYYMELGAIAKENNIHILMENQCGYKRERFVRGVCSDLSEAAEWIDSLNKELGDEVFGFCFDTCAATLCRQDLRRPGKELEKRLRAVRLRECDCFHEMSRLPFMGSRVAGESTDWRGLITGLREMDFDGTLILDAGDTMRNLSHLLRPYFYLLMRSVGDYIGWQVELEKRIKKYPQRVLFGAGNMCRKYIEHYGRQYPPIFICDNNSALWGQTICGLAIKSPEALKGLPKECAVIICNTFYEEIAEQLRELGVESIETFNDEYIFCDL